MSSEGIGNKCQVCVGSSLTECVGLGPVFCSAWSWPSLRSVNVRSPGFSLSKRGAGVCQQVTFGTCVVMVLAAPAGCRVRTCVLWSTGGREGCSVPGCGLRP